MDPDVGITRSPAHSSSNSTAFSVSALNNVLVSGMHGLGVEIAKNLIIAGVKNLTLHDYNKVELWDFSGSFVFHEEDLGINRAVVCRPKLQEINESVKISVLTSTLVKEDLKDFKVVVFTDLLLEKAMEFDDYCHEQNPPIAFILSDVRGLYGRIFCDFGPDFEFLDANAEGKAYRAMISNVSTAPDAIKVDCHVVEGQDVKFQQGDEVVFSNGKRMIGLHDGKPKKVMGVDLPSKFYIRNDPTNPPLDGTEVVVTKVTRKLLKFKTLRTFLNDRLSNPNIKITIYPLLHQALDTFRANLGRFPNAGSKEDAEKIIALVTDLNNEWPNDMRATVDAELLRHFTFGARAVLSPVAAVIGGLTAQQVLNTCSGNFHPMFQCQHFNLLRPSNLDPNDLKPINSRYDAQVSVFGAKIQKKLSAANVLIVGCGSISCEYLKNLTSMGVCCDKLGKLTVTDDALVRESDPNRHLMFRDQNIGQAKSVVAVAAARSINPNLRAEALQERLCPETESVFDYEFWKKIDIVLTTSSITNSVYVGERCFYFGNALLTSELAGPKIFSRTIIPHITNHFLVSLKYPLRVNDIEACVWLAERGLNELIVAAAVELPKFISDPNGYITDLRHESQAFKTFEMVLENLDYILNKTFEDCVRWARCKFEIHFVNKFSANDPTDMSFIKSASILRAWLLGIDIPEWAKFVDNNKFTEAMEGVEYSNNVKAVIEPNTPARMQKLIGELINNSSRLPRSYRVTPFNDAFVQSYGEQKLIFSVSLVNLLARKHGLPEIHPEEFKFIRRTNKVPEVSPAIASGLACLQLYQFVGGKRNLNDYSNVLVSLDSSCMKISTPVGASIIGTVANTALTPWDKWTMWGDPTVGDLIAFLENDDLRVIKVTFGCHCIYLSSIRAHNQILETKLLDLMRYLDNFQLPVRSRYKLLVTCEDNSRARADIPVYIYTSLW
ncbi:hypothetical protein ABFS82_12G124000 [Erythranthe guttata]